MVFVLIDQHKILGCFNIAVSRNRLETARKANNIINRHFKTAYYITFKHTN